MYDEITCICGYATEELIQVAKNIAIVFLMAALAISLASILTTHVPASTESVAITRTNTEVGVMQWSADSSWTRGWGR